MSIFGNHAVRKASLCYCILILYSCWLYYLGFFPSKPSCFSRAQWSDLKPFADEFEDSARFSKFGTHTNTPKYPKLVSKLVLLVIDGMRVDQARNLSSIKQKRLNRFDCGVLKVVARAETPTVTMPRIKAMMTGDVPAFVDILGNMDEKHFSGDSLIGQWSEAGFNITMFGDETWNRLWGDKFLRKDPVTFFVNEYVEVDVNVSRNLESELRRDDWQVMILHFGGLDHIGHLYGAFNSLVVEKLEEMDRYIEQIVVGLRKGRKNEEWMLVLTSDHGQADAGGHGGPTEKEVMTPLAFVSPLLRSRKEIDFDSKAGKDFKQIDLTSTLAILTGVPVPSRNSGIISLSVIVHVWSFKFSVAGILIAKVFESLGVGMSQVLKLLNYNTQLLKRVLSDLKSVPASVSMGLDQAAQRHELWIRNYPTLESSNLVSVQSESSTLQVILSLSL